MRQRSLGWERCRATCTLAALAAAGPRNRPTNHEILKRPYAADRQTAGDPWHRPEQSRADFWTTENSIGTGSTMVAPQSPAIARISGRTPGHRNRRGAIQLVASHGTGRVVCSLLVTSPLPTRHGDGMANLMPGPRPQGDHALTSAERMRRLPQETQGRGGRRAWSAIYRRQRSAQSTRPMSRMRSTRSRTAQADIRNGATTCPPVARAAPSPDTLDADAGTARPC